MTSLTSQVHFTNHTLTELLVDEILPFQPINTVQEELESRVGIGIAICKLGRIQRCYRKYQKVASLSFPYLVSVFFIVEGKGKR